MYLELILKCGYYSFYSNVGEAVSSRPHGTTILSASVYADLDGQKRLVGYSMFPVLKLLTHQPIKAPVQRVYSKDPSGALEILNYDIKLVIASDLNTKDSLRIAKARANLKGDFSDLKDNDKSIALAWTLSAHVNCTKYSPEMDPRFKDKPSEFFVPLRLRGLGASGFTGICKKLHSLYDSWYSNTSQSKSDTGSYMAHMYGLLLPNEYLKDLNIPLGEEAKQYVKPNLKVMIGEGTGYVYPDQTIQTKVHHPGIPETEELQAGRDVRRYEDPFGLRRVFW
eukprot:UC4_evm8s1341